MKIIDHRTGRSSTDEMFFDKIKQGDVFEFCGTIYLRGQLFNDDKNVYVTDLETGEVSEFVNEEGYLYVRLPGARLVLD
jgi:hypothetical protein